MKSLRHLIAVGAVAFTMPAQVTVPAQAGINDPEVLIYRLSGVIDDNSGFATSIYCTNFSGVIETVRVVIRAADSTLKANVPSNVAHLNTTVWSTRDVILYTNDINLNTGPVNLGTAAIAATSVNVTCNAVQVQFANTNPITAPLHMTRFSPIAGSEE